MGYASVLWASAPSSYFIVYYGDFCLLYTVEYLNECFNLDKENFVLYWRKRPGHHFQTERACSIFNTRFAGKPCGMIHETFGLQYVKIKFHGRTALAHRIIWAIHYEETPSAAIDHIDGNGLNNHISNLRLCLEGASFNNSRNRRRSRNNTSGVNGVYWRKERSKWVAKGRIYNKDGTFIDYYLGSFTDIEDAKCVRVAWEKEYGFTSREQSLLDSVCNCV